VGREQIAAPELDERTREFGNYVAVRRPRLKEYINDVILAFMTSGASNMMPANKVNLNSTSA
jgi:hypothetical protein